jgi:hypothetical protein
MPPSPIRRAALILIAGVLAACNYPGGAPLLPASTEDIVAAISATLTAQAVPAAVPSDTPGGPSLLGHSLYYLSEESGSLQVWRLEADGVRHAQITNEAMAVDGYDVSRLDGSVAFVSGNQLYRVQSDGSHRQLLVDNSAANTEADGFFYRERISNPRFSPDGRYLAYAYDGLWVLDIQTSQAVHLLSNEVDDSVPEVLYFPQEWASDSQQLIIEKAFLEGSSLAVVNPLAEELVNDFEVEGLLCCHAVWAPDNRSVLVASPYLGLVEPGLWRYDTRTGVQSTLIESASDELYQFVGWPLQLANGDLQYFYASAAELPEDGSDLPLYMVRSAADGESSRSQLRSDAFSIIEALWAEDGSLALLVHASSSVSGASGPVALVFSDGSQIQGLLDEAQQLRWGP